MKRKGNIVSYGSVTRDVSFLVPLASALIVSHRRPYSPTSIPIRHDTLGGSVPSHAEVPPMPFDDPACFRLDNIPVRSIH